MQSKSSFDSQNGVSDEGFIARFAGHDGADSARGRQVVIGATPIIQFPQIVLNQDVIAGVSQRHSVRSVPGAIQESQVTWSKMKQLLKALDCISLS